MLWCHSCLCVSAKQTEFCAWPIKRCTHPPGQGPSATHTYFPPFQLPNCQTHHPMPPSISHFLAIFSQQPHFVHHNIAGNYSASCWLSLACMERLDCTQSNSRIHNGGFCGLVVLLPNKVAFIHSTRSFNLSMRLRLKQ